MYSHTKTTCGEFLWNVASRCCIVANIFSIYTSRTIPLLDSNLAKQSQKQPSVVVKELELLRNCLDAIFLDTVLEARKYLPSVIAALANHSISIAMYPELVCPILRFGAVMSSEQYDMIAKIMNSALSDREVATVLLPLVIILYRVCENICTHSYFGGWFFDVHFATVSYGSVGGEARSPAGVVHFCTKSPHLE